MPEEVIEALQVRPGGQYIDGTLGGGGHTRALLEASAPNGRVMGIDRDPDALIRTRSALAGFGDRFVPVRGNFAEMEALAASNGLDAPEGILLDLGVSSDQLDTPERGFSFRADGPLDMRMDPEAGESVLEWLAAQTEVELVQVLRTLGEEPQARRIARAILKARDADQLTGTASLAAVVEQAVGGRKGARIHPATRTFQALRMAVNDELGSLDTGLESGLRMLVPGGRMAVITFHSLEDRAVKQTFRAHEGREVSLYEGGSRWEGQMPRVRRITRKPLTASDAEREQNPRSRSAKLRVIEKLEDV
jgi:16S rRNA (cytosine1402-N4)-methyltransferase